MGVIEAKAKPTEAGTAVVPTRTAYEADLYTWAAEQAALLRQGRLDEIDALLVAGELDDVGSAEYDELESALAVLLQHMLKWDYQPERRSLSWERSIREHRRRALRQLRKNPGLKGRLPEALLDAYQDGLDRAVVETRLRKVLPASNPYDWSAITERVFELEDEGDDG